MLGTLTLKVSAVGYRSGVLMDGQRVNNVTRATLDVRADDITRMTVEVVPFNYLDGDTVVYRGLFVDEDSPEYDLICKLLRHRG
jgi:hypothetical protein